MVLLEENTINSSLLESYVERKIGICEEDLMEIIKYQGEYKQQVNDLILHIQYGYLFRFARNGDGSSISVDKKDLITGFTTTEQIIGEASGAS